MRSILAAITLCLLMTALPVTAGVQTPGGLVGPYAGIIKDGETQSFVYNNNPAGFDCIQIVQPYRVVLRAVDEGTLRLSVGTYTTTSSDGSAELWFQRGVCTRFVIGVEGISGGPTAYTVQVFSGALANT